MLFGVGCTPDGGGDSVAAQLTVDPVETSLDLNGGVKTITVTSNASWVVESNSTDVEVAPEMGNGNGTVTVNVPETTAPRTVILTFTAKKPAVMEGVPYESKAVKTVTIYQNAGGEVVEGGIASITTIGNYDIQGAWVVAASSQSFVMTDKSGAYILVYMGTGKSVPAIGTVVNVSGDVTEFGGLLQFGTTATVNVTSETVSVNHGTPKSFSYDELTEYVNNPSIVYAELRGLLSISYGTNYNNYNIILDGGDAVKGSVSYAPTALANELNNLDNIPVVVRGYMVGHPKSNTIYANMVVLDYEVDSSTPILRANDIFNVPAAGVTDETETITVLNLGAVTATPDGTVVTAASVSGDVLTYSVSANTGADRLGSITLSAAGIEPVVVNVAQLGAIVTPTSSMEFSRAIVVAAYPDITTNGYGSQNISDIATYLTVGDFLACKVCLPPKDGDYDSAGCLQMQGNTDAAKQGRVGNTVATPGNIKKIIVESYNEKYTPNFNLALGTEQVVGTAVPSGMIPASSMTTTSEVVGSLTKYVSTYNVVGNYNYFAIYKNTTGAFYFAKITVEYATE